MEGTSSPILWLMARVIASPALVMPYRIRMAYIRALGAISHLPFRAYGRLGRYLLRKLNIEPLAPSVPQPPPSFAQSANASPKPPSEGAVAVLFSGGTDSTCTAALLAPQYASVHLLTYFERSTANSPTPTRNLSLLREKFPATKISFHRLPVDSLVRHFSYSRYPHYLRKYRWLVLATCGYSTVSWHLRTALFCLENKIDTVADGLTKELMHFPGHMDQVVEQVREFYSAFGIRYLNPVRDWPTPPDQQFVDKVIVNSHAGEFFLGDTDRFQRKTTGQFLYQQGIFSSPNVKGSSLDFSMQHDCYPFALYNILAFWGYLSVEPYGVFCQRVSELMGEKLTEAKVLLQEFQKAGKQSRLSEWV